MNDLNLVKPSKNYLSEIVAYKSEFAVAGEHLYGGARLETMSNLSEWLIYVADITSEAGVSEGRVPSSTFLCIRQSDQKMVGINIRHNLSQPFLMNCAGHIGYSIRPSKRRKGYAKEQLYLALFEIGKLGMTKALVTCDEANIGSEKTILSNGGIYENTYQDLNDGSRTKRFWIEVPVK